MPPIRRGALLAALLFLLPGLGAGVTTYDIALDGDTATVNATIELYPDNPDRTTRYSTTWGLPEETTVHAVRDSSGPIDYERTSSGVSFTTEIAAEQDKDVVEIDATVDGIVAEEHNAVALVTFQLSGFRDSKPAVPEEVTQVQLRSDRDLLAGSHSVGVDAAMATRTANYSGAGPVNVQLTMSNGGKQYDNLVLFGDGDLSVADNLYWVPVAVTGFHPPVNRYPVIVYSDEEYDERIDQWSAGQYRSGGLIFVRESTIDSDQAPAVVLHEVMHGFNDHALNWVRGDRAWVDEGTAKYVEWLINAKRDVPQAEIFGEQVSWRCGDQTRCSYEPRGTPDQLWDFYERDPTFLATWSPLQSPDAETRRFGYALSELVIRDYVRRNGADALQTAYDDFRAVNQDSGEELGGTAATQQVQRILGSDLQPCASEDRSVFAACLDAVNTMDAEIPEQRAIDRDVDRVAITPVEQPTKPNRTVTDSVLDRVDTNISAGTPHTDIARLGELVRRGLATLLEWGRSLLQ
jgi:hypothetical protein